MQKEAKNRKGKEFDETAVLRKAMVLFWRNSYEKTSMQDLVDFMNIHRRSIYDTFGDKQALFLQALRLFEETAERRIENQVNTAPSCKAAIRKLFELTVLSEDGSPPGCLIVNTAVELTVHEPVIVKSFSKTEALIRSLLEKGQLAGEISGTLDAATTAEFIHNSFVGIRVLAKTTKDRQKLHSIIDTTLAVLD